MKIDQKLHLIIIQIDLLCLRIEVSSYKYTQEIANNAYL